MIEELLRIENKGNDFVLVRIGKEYGISFAGKIGIDHYLSKPGMPVSVLYILKPGDIEHIMHALIDVDKL